MKKQIIVVGAGPGGSTAAFYLAKAGVDVFLVDKAIWPREKPCGDCYLDGVFPIFEDMGIMEEMKANRFDYITRQRLVDAYEETFDFAVQPQMCVPRRIGDDIIRRAAVKAGAQFMEDFDVTDLIMKKGVVKGIKGYYKNETISMECDAVVIANGSHSMISRKLGGFSEDNQVINYACRGYFKNVSGLDKGVDWQFYYPESFHAHGGLCMLWVYPLHEEDDGMASIGMTVPQHTLEEADMSIQQMYDWWCENSKFAKEVFKIQDAEIIGGEMHAMRLPSCNVLQKCYAAGAITIGDAANAAESAFDYGITSAMIGAKIAAEVLADCVKKNDFSEEALSVFQKLAEDALNPGLIFNTKFRQELLAKFDVFENWLHWAKEQPDYPNQLFGVSALTYLNGVLGVDVQLPTTRISQ